MEHISGEKISMTYKSLQYSLPCSHYLSLHALHDETKSVTKINFDNNRTIIFSHLDKRPGMELIFDNHWTITFSDLGIQREI